MSESLQRSDGPDHPAIKLSSPAALAIANRSAAAPELQTLHALGMDVSNFPLDYQIHLQYFATDITNNHYSLSMEIGESFTQVMLSEASKNELLLNAVVAFSAYLSTVRNPDGKLKDFLQYYNRSVTLLLDALKRKDTHNIPTLLTILQLSTIEVGTASRNCLSLNVLLTYLLGVSGRLDQPNGASKGRMRNTYEYIYDGQCHGFGPWKNLSLLDSTKRSHRRSAWWIPS